MPASNIREYTPCDTKLALTSIRSPTTNPQPSRGARHSFGSNNSKVRPKVRNCAKSDLRALQSAKGSTDWIVAQQAAYVQMSFQAEMQDIPEMRMVEMCEDPQELCVEVDCRLRESRRELPSRLGWEHRLVANQLLGPLNLQPVCQPRTETLERYTYGQNIVRILGCWHLDLLFRGPGRPGVVLIGTTY
jgi:hypothetical protein